MRYGAPENAWSHFADRLDLTAELLPVVSNPNAVIAQRSTMKALGKTPSVYDRNREVVGLGKWTAFHASAGDVERWSREPDYGIAIQARAIRAIDIDVPDSAKADAIEQMIVDVLDGIVLPARRRENSGKRLLAFRYAEPMTKRVAPVDGGIVEFLGDGQQFIASGMHESGTPYAWDCASGLPASIPTLTDEDLNAVWSTLVALFATGEPTIARAKREGMAAEFDGALTDSFGQWLARHWEIYDTGGDGQLFMRCPFEDDHTGDSGITSTAYFMAGTGGYERGHVKCLHAHCMARTDHDFQVKTGYIGDGFEALPPRAIALPEARQDDFLPPANSSTDPLVLEATENLILPDVARDKAGSVIVNADTINKLLSTPAFTGIALAYDTFRSAIMWAPAKQQPPQWREFGDNDYVMLEIAFVRRKIDPPGHDTLRRWVRKAAADNQFDSAQEWLRRLRWDGVPRVDRFLRDYLGAAADAGGYDVAVSRYLWSALAGRVMSPGVQADMVPILYGEQGARKTSAVRALVPAPEFYAAIDMSVRDEDTARLMRGTLVNELEELRGLRSRDAESIKAWITKKADKWTPKYVEFASTYLRRSVMIATTNRDDVLDDPTGERRWLPVTVGAAGKIDVEAIERDRDQLWAEGSVLFLLEGVAWSDAERLAPAEQMHFKADDRFAEPITEWLSSVGLDGKPVSARMHRIEGEGISNRDVAVGIGLAQRATDHSTLTGIGIAMRKLGFLQRQSGASRTRRWFLKV